MNSSSFDLAFHFGVLSVQTFNIALLTFILSQLNFFQCHTKIIVCPLLGAVTFIDEDKRLRTFPLKNIEKHGCSIKLYTRVNYARKMIQKHMLPESENQNGKKE